MYFSTSSHRFSDVDECLEILSVASELLVDKLMQQCMRYLEVVRWNSEQESKIRNLLSSLNLSVLPDLNARIDKQNNNYLDFVRENIKAMISFVSSCDCAEKKQPIILEEFKANIAIAVISSTENNPANEEHSYFALLWPFTLMKLPCKGSLDATVTPVSTIIFPFPRASRHPNYLRLMSEGFSFSHNILTVASMVVLSH
ncbi:hypothetical protein SUGI_1479100 [Cryptomeria japonica]|uniref:Uncharacterized protein n=1 Tax=Cryptomeria japonica TaxID=3369 RepID=A0AAD3NTD0_CRYJA|nr:hypothetical protein SUGI_1070310 [Cryptomeria japonica]GLJ58818.1 hypothetical protein SUGI_1479100 [Cryptomeria japonica]